LEAARQYQVETREEVLLALLLVVV